MYYKSSIVLSDELKRLEREELEKKVVETAKRVQRFPCFFIFPFLFDKDSIHVAYEVYKNCLSYFYDFLKELGLEESKFSRKKISYNEYEERMTEATNCGYKFYSTRLYKGQEEIVEELEVPREEVVMPRHTEYPISLKREIKRIQDNSNLSPTIYYIVSESRNRRADMRKALIYSLKEEGRISSPHYFNLILEKDYYGYNSNWSLVDSLYEKAKDCAVTFSLSFDSPISSFDNVAKDFATSLAKHHDRCITIIESDRYLESLVKIINRECHDSRLVLLEDPGYTKEDLKNIAKRYEDEDLYIDYEYVFNKIDNSIERYFSEEYVNDLEDHIYELDRFDSLKEADKEVDESFFSSFYIKKDSSPIDTLKEEPIFEGAKTLIDDIIREHDFLEERKLRGLEGDIKPLYRKSYNKWRRYSYEITTELPSLNMIFYGDRGTGKERTAELYASVLNQFGLIVKDSFKSIKKGEVISEYPKETVNRIKKILERNKGGVVYIDWGERVISEEENKEEDILLDSIIKLMDEYKRKMVIILSMSEKSMKAHFSSNSESLSFIPYILHFPSLSTDELWTYFNFLASKEGYICSSGVKDKIKEVLDRIKTKESFAGRISVESMFEKAKMNMARRISLSPLYSLSDKALSTLMPQDFDNLSGLDLELS